MPNFNRKNGNRIEAEEEEDGSTYVHRRYNGTPYTVPYVEWSSARFFRQFCGQNNTVGLGTCQLCSQEYRTKRTEVIYVQLVEFLVELIVKL